jgi:hypothetical protein
MPHQVAPLRNGRRCLLALALAVGCAGLPGAGSGSLAWLRGSWIGVRRDGEDGSEARMTLVVEELPGGAGLVERLQVLGSGEPYTGFATFSRVGSRVGAPSGSGRWVMLYANSVRDSFARLEGEVAGDGSATLDSVTPGRTRESRLVLERLDARRCRRTQHVSEDGGATWRVWFVDELTRAD